VSLYPLQFTHLSGLLVKGGFIAVSPHTPPPLTRKGSYNGTRCANPFKKQANLHKGAAGSAKISVFFASVLKPTRQPIEVLKITSSSYDGTSSDLGEEDWVDIPSLPLQPHLSMTPVPGTPASDVAELQSSKTFL